MSLVYIPHMKLFINPNFIISMDVIEQEEDKRKFKAQRPDKIVEITTPIVNSKKYQVVIFYKNNDDDCYVSDPYDTEETARMAMHEMAAIVNGPSYLQSGAA